MGWAASESTVLEDIDFTVPAGLEQTGSFGRVPSFRNAEILSLHLDCDGPSLLRMHGRINAGQVGAFVLAWRVIVKFLERV